MKILLGIDGSKHSEWAVEYIAGLPFINEPEIYLLHVVELPTHNVPMMLDVDTRKKVINLYREKNLNAGKKILNEFQKKISSRFKSVTAELVEGDIADKLIEKAEREGIDMVIVGSRGLSNIAAFVLGSVSQRLMTYAPCSVLIVKKRVRAVSHIIVAVDGSKYSDLSVNSIISWLSPEKTTVTLLNISSNNIEVERFSITEKYSFQLEKAGFNTKTVYTAGNPAEVILDLTNKKKAALVIVGAKGNVGLKRFLLGSVSRKVATYAENSVLVLRGTV